MNRYILSIDLGTTGNRVFLFNESGKPFASAYSEFKQYFPKPGYVEHDAVEILDSILKLITEVCKSSSVDKKAISCIGITNQRETTLIWNKKSGKPVHNAIVWQCRRTAAFCDELIAGGHQPMIRSKTGLVIDAYFSATKIKWLLDSVPDVREAADNGELLFGTIDSWILWNLTGRVSHLTEYTNASRTMLYNIHTLSWDDELLSLFNVPKQLLPSVVPSASNFGTTNECGVLPDGIPITGIAGDQQAALVGQNCVLPGRIKNTYGTGCFILQNIGSTPIESNHGLITTLAADNTGGLSYALEGSVFIGGAVMQWLRDYMNFFSDASESSDMCHDLPDDNLVFVPAFTGLGAPHWKMDARGAIFGITRDTTQQQIVRAALKSIAFQSYDAIQAMQNDSSETFGFIRADGGATANDYLMQFQADILQVQVQLPEVTESTALGAAYLAGVGAGIYKTIEEVASRNVISRQFDPVMSRDKAEEEIAAWNRAVKRIL
ncbi:MAG: glycerol kinase GlpK [Spirochaetes bacterium]|jgi:glycerol kinase|nr:glycerol kinase GlpK [Spirochaetota bacterium]